jgi:hypothetical protein
MIPRPITVPFAIFFAGSLVSCDKAKDIADKATAAAKEQINTRISSTSAEAADSELQKLVDQTPEGVHFRKDLPFPTRLEVRTARRSTIAGRHFQNSAIDKRVELVKGTRVSEFKLERTALQVRYTLTKSSFAIPTADGENPDGQPAPDPVFSSPTTRPLSFRKTGDVWKAESTDTFRSELISKQIVPVFGQLLVENALAPRPLWFTNKRMKPGDEVVVTGATLPMLLEGKAKGSLTLTLDSLDAVNGHPCGVFTVTGDYSRDQFPDFEGNLIDEEVTIQSGKMWLSLIHPVVLREELDTIQTFSSTDSGGQKLRGQGTVKISTTRDWKAL